jgi:hypothetical protein
MEKAFRSCLDDSPVVSNIGALRATDMAAADAAVAASLWLPQG